MKKYSISIAVLTIFFGVVALCVSNDPFRYVGIYKNIINRKEATLDLINIKVPGYCYLNEVVNGKYEFNCIRDSEVNYAISIVRNVFAEYNGVVLLLSDEYQYRNFEFKEERYNYICNENYCRLISDRNLRFFLNDL